MDFANWLTLFIAIYGAGISTVLGVRELQRESRKIKILLDYEDMVERARIVIINVGHRPITITDIAIATKPPEYKSHFMPIYSSDLFSADLKEYPLPKTLQDGELLIIPLSTMVSDVVGRNMDKVKVTVYDAEGQIYYKYKRRRLDHKFTRYY